MICEKAEYVEIVDDLGLLGLHGGQGLLKWAPGHSPGLQEHDAVQVQD